MQFDLYCPRCQIEFEATAWENGACPNCDNEYWWEEYWMEELGEMDIVVEWEDYDKIVSQININNNDEL